MWWTIFFTGAALGAVYYGIDYLAERGVFFAKPMSGTIMFIFWGDELKFVLDGLVGYRVGPNGELIEMSPMGRPKYASITYWIWGAVWIGGYPVARVLTWDESYNEHVPEGSELAKHLGIKKYAKQKVRHLYQRRIINLMIGSVEIESAFNVDIYVQLVIRLKNAVRPILDFQPYGDYIKQIEAFARTKVLDFAGPGGMNYTWLIETPHGLPNSEFRKALEREEVAGYIIESALWLDFEMSPGEDNQKVVEAFRAEKLAELNGMAKIKDAELESARIKKLGSTYRENPEVLQLDVAKTLSDLKGTIVFGKSGVAIPTKIDQ